MAALLIGIARGRVGLLTGLEGRTSCSYSIRIGVAEQEEGVSRR